MASCLISWAQGQIYLFTYLPTCLSIYISMLLSSYLSISGSETTWTLAAFSVSYTDGRTPWTGDQPMARPAPTQRINAHRHPCLEWDSNPRPQVRAGEDGSCARLRGHCRGHVKIAKWKKKSHWYIVTRTERGTIASPGLLAPLVLLTYRDPSWGILGNRIG
jgi:hypothetical protein